MAEVQLSRPPKAHDMPLRFARTAAIALTQRLRDVVIVGRGCEGLAAHFVNGRAAVTVLHEPQEGLDPPEREVLTEGIRFISARPGELARHIGAESQDAIYLIDVVERLPSAELRWLMSACRTALRPEGVCCVLSTEQRCQPTRRQELARRPGVMLCDIEALRALASESFEYVDAFTWNGLERFEEPGCADDLLALARPAGPYRAVTPTLEEWRAAGVGHSGWLTAKVATDIPVPSRCVLRTTLHVRTAPRDAVIHLLVTSPDPGRYSWIGIRRRLLVRNPAQLMVGSESFTDVGGGAWGQAGTIVARIRSETSSECDIRVSNLSLLVV